MSFIDITDPKKRDVIVAEYLSTMKRIQKRNIDERIQDLVHKEQLDDLFTPMVKSNEESTASLVNELRPLREEIKNVAHTYRRKPLKAQKRGWDESRGNALDFYLNNVDTKSIDSYFGIQRMENGTLMMGNKIIQMDGNDIVVDDVKYNGTPGLWSLIMSMNPNGYSEEDLASYKELVHQTRVNQHPRVLHARNRPYSTNKWKNILKGIRSSGSAIVFLPADIKGMHEKLNLLLGEYVAGNKTSTKNEIVFILDELLRRRAISRKEYTNINTYLSKC